MIPRILIFHTLDWPNAARLAIAFGAADCRVHALCQPDHPLNVVSCVDRVHTLNLFAPLTSLRSAIDIANPDFIVPCDDTAVAHLHRLHHQETSSSSESPTRIATLIERSLGDPASYQQLELRSQLPAIAAASEVQLPRTEVVHTLNDLRQWANHTGFPAVLKTDRSWGGEGVAIVENLAQAEEAFSAMSRRPNLMRAMKRVLFDRDPNLIIRKFVDPPPTISIQQFIRGKLANTAVACWKGETIAALSVEVIASFCQTGTSTVVHPVENPQMRETAERITRHLGISGFCGFDFVIEQGSCQAYLLEINPRGTQINHLILGHGRDLPGALRARIAQEPPRPPTQITSAQTIALFPQEWERDPNSSFLATGYLDLPNDEPAMIKAFQSAPGKSRRSKFAGFANRGYPKPDCVHTPQ